MVSSSAFGSGVWGAGALTHRGPSSLFSDQPLGILGFLHSRNHGDLWKDIDSSFPKFIAHILSWTWSVLTEHVKELILRKFC